MLPVDNDKPTVIALREIADGLVDAKILVQKPTVEIDDETDSLQAAIEAVEAESGDDGESEGEAVVAEVAAESTDSEAPAAEDTASEETATEESPAEEPAAEDSESEKE